MSYTLHYQMDTLFHHGLILIRQHKQSIHEELGHLKHYFKEHGKKTTPSTFKSVEIFSDLILHNNDEKEMLLQKLKTSWEKEIGANSPVSPFMMSLLESAVHHAIQSSGHDHDTTHQSIQYFFLKINEFIHTVTPNNPFSIDTFLQQIVYSKQLPIEWIALAKESHHQCIVTHWFQKNQCTLTKEHIIANSIFELSDILLHQFDQSDEYRVITVPYQQEILLVCTLKQDISHIMPFIYYALQFFRTGKQAIQQMAQSRQWMDAVLLFNESIIKAHTLDKALEMITTGFVHYLPFKRCAIFSYSKQEEIAFGLSSHQLDSRIIQNITEEMHNLPLIKDSLDFIQMLGERMKYLQPLYMKNARNYFPGYYIDKFQLKSVVITPLYTSSGNELIGAAILDQGENSTFHMSFDTYNALIHFGKTAGETLLHYNHHIHPTHAHIASLSPRELEVLALMADGESTTTAAQSLHLSEYTVRDYITAIMQKMKARNRTEAVALAIRRGII